MDEGKKYNLKSDVVFKAFFSRKGNEKFLIDFLNALLKIKIKNIKIKDEVSVQKLFEEEKGGRLDLQAELDDGLIVNIEMQMRDENNIIERAVMYGAKVKAREEGKGIDYNDLKKVIMINILNYNLFEYNEYINETVTVLEKHREHEVTDDMKYYFIELPKFRKQRPDMNNRLNQWLYLIDDTDKEAIEMVKTKNPKMKEAVFEIGHLTGDAAERRMEELREKWEFERKSAIYHAEKFGREEGREEGEKIGRKQGEKQKALQIAKNMLNESISIDIIVKVTGLTKEEIEKLK